MARNLSRTRLRAHDSRLNTLADMLTYCRPAGSRTETEFIARYLAGLPGAGKDEHGNIHVWIGQSPIIWSCHTDTVHRRPGRQRLTVTDDRIALAPGGRSSCLGADDTVGVWIAREMILAGVPGHYVFHFGEEIGGIGSRAIVADRPDLFAGARFCIALDRAGTTDVITHQSRGRCCSDAFAESLAVQLRDVAPFKPCDTGVYTDSAEYVGIVGECTNLSVGYYRAHSPDEYADPRHALALLDALCRLDVSALVAERAPGVPDRWEDVYDWDDWKYGEPADRASDGQPWLRWGISERAWYEMSADDRALAESMFRDIDWEN